MWVLGALVTYGGALAFIEMGHVHKNWQARCVISAATTQATTLVSFVFSYVVCLLIRPATVAAGASAFSDLFLYAVGGGSQMPHKNKYLYDHRAWIGRGIAAIAMTLVVLLNIVSVRWSIRVVNVLAVMKVVVLLIICIVGILVLAGAIKVAPTNNWKRGFTGTSNPSLQLRFSHEQDLLGLRRVGAISAMLAASLRTPSAIYLWRWALACPSSLFFIFLLMSRFSPLYPSRMH